MDAQPALHRCVIKDFGSGTSSNLSELNSINVSEGGFQSLLSTSKAESVEIEKDLMCCKCKYLVIHPVEC